LETMKRRLDRRPQEVLEGFHERMFSPAEVEEGALDAWNETGRGDWAVETLKAGLDYLGGYRAYERPPPAVAVHLLHGDRDKVCPPAAAQKLSRWATAGLTVFENAGHCPWLTRPDDFHRWLSEAAGPP
ncbi:MAG: alpha/beta fold hydrolase, partial [Actinomycetota bacterium]